MHGLWTPGMIYIGAAIGGVHFYNRSVVKCNIMILQEEIQNTKNNRDYTRELKDALVKQRLYEGKLIYFIPPPRVDIRSMRPIYDPRAYPT